MIRRSFFLTSLFSLCILAPIGCAVSTEDGSEDAALETESQDLSAAASKLVGKYYSQAATDGGFSRLTLEANGKYHAERDPDGEIVCITSPCRLPESGTWNATANAGGGYRLRVRPGGGPSRFYDAVRKGGTLTLARASRTETLTALDPNGCLDDADCSASEQCGPKLCLMWCEVGDPFCCGPSICEPKAPPPPSCWGAWLDQSGTCRTPADGVYPDACCAGQTTPCGPANCGVGETCCNPLSGICTKPGMACTQ